MNKIQLKKEMEGLLEVQKDMLSSKKKIMPTAVIFSKLGVGIAPMPFKNESEKHIMIAMVSKLAIDTNADAIIFVLEMWYVVEKIKNKSDVGKTRLEYRPSEHPDRKECICVYGECGASRIVLMQAFRREKEKIVFEPLHEIDDFKSIFDTGLSRGSFDNPMYQ